MRMFVSLYPDESKALGELAQQERRHPREQAALLIRRGLELAGVLSTNAQIQPQADRQQANDHLQQRVEQ